MKKITNEMIGKFKVYLMNEEKSNATIEKYIHDINVFHLWCSGGKIEKSLVLEYKQYLIGRYAPASVNAHISSLNSFFDYMNWYDCKIKTLKIQKQIFANKNKELTREEYERLLKAAKDKQNERLYLVMQTICSTGIRVSELKFITAEALKCGQASVSCKGKLRIVLLPKRLCKMLREYIKKHRITSGSVFVTRNGKPLDRTNIWSDMKKLCERANVLKEKVFPHNLRHLFARTYYSVQKDVVRLADILGHSNVNTTRIYTIETGEIHRSQIERLGLLRYR
ncbi:MAG: tyrosine-type recombinase/integrase [Clostridia bacterium]|nr:tyrosine-type recombinase/integrase [Clostridia bacterium]